MAKHGFARQRILQLEDRVEALRGRVAELSERLAAELKRSRERAEQSSRVFAAGRRGDIVAVRPGERPPWFSSSSQALVRWQPFGR